MDQFYRGDVIPISDQPTGGPDGDKIYPVTMVAHINYVVLGGRSSTTVNLVQASGDSTGPYVGLWDTSQVAALRPGVTDVSIRGTMATGDEIRSYAKDLEFEILANVANPGA